jgi:hypothetical protein
MLHTFICFPCYRTYNLSFSPSLPASFEVPCIPPLANNLGLISLSINHDARLESLLPCQVSNTVSSPLLRETYIAATPACGWILLND